MSAIDLTKCSNLVTAILNASTQAYGTNDDSMLHEPSEINDAIFASDHEICAVILDTPGHRSRRFFITTKTITDGASINDPFEGGVLIDGKPGKPMSPGTLQRLKYNPNNNTITTGYYCIQGTIISFTGGVCTIDYVNFSADASNLQAPAEYIDVAICGALAKLYVKEGTNVQAGQHFASMYEGMLGLIKQGSTTFGAATPFFKEVPVQESVRP